MQLGQAFFKRLAKILVIFGLSVFAGWLGSKLWLPAEEKYQPSIAAIEEYFNQGESLDGYNEAIGYSKEHPNDSTALKYLGEALFQLERYQESNENFQSALQDKDLTNDQRAEINFLIGRNYYFLVEADKAAAYFKQALQIDPNYGASYNALGLMALKDKRYQEAFSYLNQELSLIPDATNNPTAAYAYYYLAQAYGETNDLTQAKLMLDKAQVLGQQLPAPVVWAFLDKVESLRAKIEIN